jgi:Protein of unknown function (DUF2851)
MLALPETTLQRAVQLMLSDPAVRWKCTNGDDVQIVAAGTLNVYDGPDFRDMAVLHAGTVYVGMAEFHRRSSDWYDHRHQQDRRYARLLLHVVFYDDIAVPEARWTLVVDPARLRPHLKQVTEVATTDGPAIDELQHHALLRLLRLTAEADIVVRRLGTMEATRCLTAAWLDRLHRRRRRPLESRAWEGIRERIGESAFGRLLRDVAEIAPENLAGAMAEAERQRIAMEGDALRRELLVNVFLPLLCAIASDGQRIVLLQWYWSARSPHPYGNLSRKHPGLPQAYVWQQQGLLEYERYTAPRLTTCADIVRSYGLSGTLRFLEVATRA